VDGVGKVHVGCTAVILEQFQDGSIHVVNS
jgi:hypothetical protein